MNNDLISREDLKSTIIGFCGKCSNIITKYENGVPDGNCAIQHILNMIDNSPSVEYPFYAEAYQTGYEEAKKDRPLYKGVLFVDDYGINKVIEVDENGTVTAEIIIPRDTFIEAYNKFINTDMKGGVK